MPTAKRLICAGVILSTQLPSEVEHSASAAWPVLWRQHWATRSRRRIMPATMLSENEGHVGCKPKLSGYLRGRPSPCVGRGKALHPVFHAHLATAFRTMPDLSLGLTFLPQGGLDRRSRHLALSSWPIDALCREADSSRSLRCLAWVQTRLWLLPVSSRPGIRRCVGYEILVRRLVPSLPIRKILNADLAEVQNARSGTKTLPLCLSFWTILASR